MWKLAIFLVTLVSLLVGTKSQFQNRGCLPGDYPFPASDSCTSFLRCFSGQVLILRCPLGQNFDFARRQCRPQVDVDCTQQLRLFIAIPSPDGNPGPAINIFRGLNQGSNPPNPLNQFGQGGFSPNNRFQNNGFGRGFGLQPGNTQFQRPQQFPGNNQGFSGNNQGFSGQLPGSSNTNQFSGGPGFGFGQSNIGVQQQIVPGQSVLSGNTNAKAV